MYTIQYHWDYFVWALTLVVCGACCFSLLLFIIGVVFMVGIPPLPMLLVSLCLGIVILICEGLAPQRLEISSSAVTILRRYRSVRIPSSDILSIKPVGFKEVFPILRLKGNCGLFGYVGCFKSKKIGHFRMYATEMKHLFLLQTAECRYVISCREAEHFEKLLSDIGKNVYSTSPVGFEV